jgi:hypothetical protein
MYWVEVLIEYTEHAIFRIRYRRISKVSVEEKGKAEEAAEKTGEVVGKGFKKGFGIAKGIGKGLVKGVKGDKEEKKRD